MVDPETFDDGEGRREVWEQRFSRHDTDDEFCWGISETPPQLVALLGGPHCPARTAAVDVGCGTGTSTARLADEFDFTVGFDFAQNAVERAAARMAGSGRRVAFLVADASKQPFRSGAFSFFYDRGCFHDLPPVLWSSYWAEADRLVQDGGVMQLMTATYVGEGAPVLSRGGLLRRLRFLRKRLRARGRPMHSKQLLTPEALAEMKPPSLEIVQSEQVQHQAAQGHRLAMTWTLLRKR